MTNVVIKASSGIRDVFCRLQWHNFSERSLVVQDSTQDAQTTSRYLNWYVINQILDGYIPRLLFSWPGTETWTWILVCGSNPNSSFCSFLNRNAATARQILTINSKMASLPGNVSTGGGWLKLMSTSLRSVSRLTECCVWWWTSWFRLKKVSDQRWYCPSKRKVILVNVSMVLRWFFKIR